MLKKLRIVYFGFDLFADCFEKLLGMGNVEIMALYTFKTDNVFEFNTKVCALAEKNNIEVHTERITVQKLSEYFDMGCNLTISAGYIYKIPILNRSEFRGINIHPALLPVGRGAWPFPCTILKGLEFSGVTIHKITEGFDEGDILLQDEFNVAPDETLDTLTKKSQILATQMVEKCITNFEHLWQSALPQGKGEYWKEPTDTNRTINSGMTVQKANLLVRAFGSYGVIFNGEVYKSQTSKALKISLKDGNFTLYK